MLKKILLVLMIMALPSISSAEQPLTYDRVNFSVSVTREVENDTVAAILYAQLEGSEARGLADKVNKDIAWAVELVKKAPNLKVQTEGYQTLPVYSKQRLSGWRVRQSMTLETQDPAALSELLGQLQQRLAIQSITYSISPKCRQTVEKQLVSEALTRFQERAAMVTEQFKRPDYRIVNLDINTGGGPPVYPMARNSMMMAAEASVSPPSLETGTDIVTVTVNGTIELQIR